MLSWRVAILPYLNEQALFDQFKLDEPWDGPHNSKLLMPKLFESSGEPPGTTRYQVFVGPGAIFDDDPVRKRGDPPRAGRPNVWRAGAPRLGLRINDIHDGTSNTILIAEARKAVPWSKPEDLLFDPAGPLPALGEPTRDGFSVAMADGSVRFVSKNTGAEILLAAITRNGGEKAKLP